MASFSKFIRPEKSPIGVISERDLDIIEAILRYRFSPTSELVRLVGGNHVVTMRRLRKLWEAGLINRFAFPGIRNHSEFSYYLDSPPDGEFLERRHFDPTGGSHGTRLKGAYPKLLGLVSFDNHSSAPKHREALDSPLSLANAVQGFNHFLRDVV